MRTNNYISWSDDDRESGPFVLRQSGTSNFVEQINSGYYTRFGVPSESVTFVRGWQSPKRLTYSTMEEAINAAEEVSKIEGVHITIEPTGEQ